jgi:rhodanese-related sulfurtransferase
MWSMIPEWSPHELLAAQQAADPLQRPEVIDVREAWEVAQLPMPGARHLPMHLVPLSCDTLPSDRPIVVVCHSGARSSQVVHFLYQKGFRSVFNLRGGMIAWMREVGSPPSQQEEAR